MVNPQLLQILCPSKSLNSYQKFTPDAIKQIRHIAKSLQGIKLIHLNATAVGGGVIEMLRPEVALQQDIGLKSNLFVIPPNLKFFEITKKIHNLLQGKTGRLTNQEQKGYLQYNKLIAQALSELNPQPDLVLIHDPQPLASISFLKNSQPKTILWRCHIDTSSPNQNAWNFVARYLNFYHHFVFTNPEYIQNNFPPLKKVSFITPVIDPLSPKNTLMDKTKARQYLRKFGIDTSKYLITQISRLDPWKDPLGVIDAYRIAKRVIPNMQLALVAQSANDDPEGEKLYLQVKNYIQEEKDIFLLKNLPANDQAINAFQTGSDIIMQKSTREGFGLTVTEAMWKGAVVIAGNAGGIRIQIKNGVNGFLVNSPFEAAEKIIYILKHPDITKKISKNAHQTIKRNFLLPHALLSYLKLFKSLINLPAK